MAEQTEQAALVAALMSEQHAPMNTHDPETGECRECPWPVHALPPAHIAAAILASPWLAAHDRQVAERAAAQALRDAADDLEAHGKLDAPVPTLLHARADSLAPRPAAPESSEDPCATCGKPRREHRSGYSAYRCTFRAADPGRCPVSPVLPSEERDAMVDRATCETAGPVFPDTYTWHYRRDVPALLDALDAAEAEKERLHEHYVRAVDDAVHAAIERDEARAALARVEGLASRWDTLSSDMLRAALAAAPSETEEGR